MRIEVNGEARDVTSDTLDAALDELGFGEAAVATALNGAFVPASMRCDQLVRDGDRLEVLAPMQGG